MAAASYRRETSRLVIPVPQSQSIHLVGTLERLEGNQDEGNKLALILHGALGHKDYLFQKKLGQSLPIDSFRFDFRGNHESSGSAGVSNFANDMEDIRTVVAYLVEHYDYKISLVIGHSRGSVIGLKWLCTEPGARYVEAYVIISGRYRMDKILGLRDMLEPHFKKQGYYDRTFSVAGKTVTVRSYPENYVQFASWDNSYIWTKCPPHVDVLIIHGIRDEVVPVYDALIWADALSGRNPGTQSLHLVEEADHNLIGFRDEVVQVVLEWWGSQQKKSLKGGIWKTLSRSRL